MLLHNQAHSNTRLVALLERLSHNGIVFEVSLDPPVNGVLNEGVGVLHGHRGVGSPAQDVDQLTAALGQEVQHGCVRAVVGAQDVGLQHLQEGRRVGIHAGAVGPGDAGVVDPDVHLPVRLEGKIGQGLHLRVAAHVAGHAAHLPAAGLQLLHGFGHAGLVSRGDHHACPFSQEGSRRRQPQAARPTGNYRNFSRKNTHDLASVERSGYDTFLLKRRQWDV